MIRTTGASEDAGPAGLSGLVLRERRYAGGARQGKHSHRLHSITLIYAGSLRERAGGCERTGGPLSIIVKPSGTEHADHFGPAGARTLQLTLAEGALAEQRSDALSRWSLTTCGPASRSFLAVLTSFRENPAGDPVLEASIYDLIASISGERARRGREGVPPPWLRKVSDRVRDTLSRSPRIRDLAREAGVHPVSLARRYRRHYGLSVTEDLRRRRVAAAAALLGGSGVPLAGVALDSGFSDQSHMTRVFRNATGLTPAGFRALVRAR